MFIVRLSLLPFVLLVCSVSFVSGQDSVTPDETKEKLAYSIGVQAYIYGQPLMDTYRTFWENTLDPNRGHDRTVNEFNFVRKLVSREDTWVVSPNNDTMYSRGFLDLTDEPIVLHIPRHGKA